MRVYRATDYNDMSRKAANILSAQVILKPHCVLGLATGSTPLGTYKQLIEWYRKGDIDFSEVTTINLDEYAGLKRDGPNSYHYFMKHNFWDHVNISPDNTNIPDGTAPDPEGECVRYDRLISRSGGIDMQLLGLGHNGHIGFNEPGGAFDKDTHRVKLTDMTIEANKRFFEREEDVPRYAYTMGIRSIMQSRRIIVIASGAHKAKIVREAFFGPVTPAVPASVLQLHNDVILVGDAGAMSLI
ncbi:MAG: glucosamine-6-phosphate deaminase [Synergistaceae bacterium]|jgi:glucosamine-6-phosphate deaminase|nr:glucosamine-6-phosphate deaminase [Synergistaceae bacterium]